MLYNNDERSLYKGMPTNILLVNQPADMPRSPPEQRPRHRLREKAKRGTALQWITSHRELGLRRTRRCMLFVNILLAR